MRSSSSKLSLLAGARLSLGSLALLLRR